jgi:hypothetical protein
MEEQRSEDGFLGGRRGSRERWLHRDIDGFGAAKLSADWAHGIGFKPNRSGLSHSDKSCLHSFVDLKTSHTA